MKKEYLRFGNEQAYIIQAPKVMRKMTMVSIFIGKSSCTRSMFHVLGDVGAKLNLFLFRFTCLMLRGFYGLESFYMYFSVAQRFIFFKFGF